MNLQKITDGWKALIVKLADYGVPVPVLRDPFTKKPSLPFSMIVISLILVIIGVIGKLSVLVGGIDMPNAMQLLSTSAALYFGHSWVHKETNGPNGSSDTIEVKADKSDKEQ